jgi:hypothetical protein
VRQLNTVDTIRETLTESNTRRKIINIVLALTRASDTLKAERKMKLIVEIKNVYGVPRVYPVCAKSHSFARIAGLKTLSPEVIEEIKKMGYKLTEEKKEI